MLARISKTLASKTATTPAMFRALGTIPIKNQHPQVFQEAVAEDTWMPEDPWKGEEVKKNATTHPPSATLKWEQNPRLDDGLLGRPHLDCPTKAQRL
eukprot:g18735.t1